jgi:hypothetical protein
MFCKILVLIYESKMPNDGVVEYAIKILIMQKP